jgi:GNAT superfamily N-acetyltransferase
MNTRHPILLDEEDCRELEQALVDRIYEFNVQATGYGDGRLIGGCIRSEAGDLVAGCSGHTWGGCSVVTHLWVTESCRHRGLGRWLLQSAEAEAFRRNCSQVILSTHSFQAPGFYERLGFARVASVEDWPKGHSATVYRKILVRDPGTMPVLQDAGHLGGG